MSQDVLEYATYFRKSNGRKAVPRQKAITGALVKKRGGTVIAEFTDSDSTAYAKPGAARPDRDDFDRMLAFLATRRGLRVAAYHADRLTRNQEDTAALIRVCTAGGHIVETPSGTYDLSNATGRRRLRDDASAAEYEVDHDRERILAQKDEAAESGLWLGGRRPFGWEIDPNPVDEDGEPRLDEDGEPLNGVLRLRGAEADPLRDAHHAVLAGMTTGAIARQWNAQGLRGTSGGQWTGNEVRRVLLRPRNAGLQLHRGEIAGAAEAASVVDELTWRAVRAILSDPARKTSPGPQRAHLLSGLALCGVCGHGLTSGQVAGKDRAGRTVYRCRQPGKDGPHVHRDAVELDRYITMIVIERLSRPDAADLLRKDTAVDLAALHREKAAIETAMAESNELRKARLLTATEFAEERASHLADLEVIAEKMAAAGRTDVLAAMIGDPAAAWELRSLDERRAIIDTLLILRVLPQPKGRPKGWIPGSSYFDPAVIDQGIEWRRREPQSSQE